MRPALVELFRDQQFEPGDYAPFFVAGDGTSDDPETEDVSGYIIDRDGVIWWFATCDHLTGLSVGRVDTECIDQAMARWANVPEYQAARRAVGLSAPELEA